MERRPRREAKSFTAFSRWEERWLIRSVRRATCTSEEPVSLSCRRLPVMILLFDCAAIRRKPYAKRISSQCWKLATALVVGGGGRVMGSGGGFKA